MGERLFYISRPSVFIGGLLGLLFFLLIFGVAILDPQNIGWLLQANNQDSVQHFVGWEFFRNEPWDFPLGVIHHYGFPISTSIVYTDSIPLLALFFKCFSTYLPPYFQYFGLWYALCYFLQGMFAWLISEKISNDGWIKILITCFFLLSPIMLNRTLEHQALVAQWVLLAALLLYWQPLSEKSMYYWLVLNIITVLIHAYLACMVIFIWGLFLYKNVCMERKLIKTAACLQILLNIIFILLTAWIVGYFVLSLSEGIEASGYSLDAMNILAPFIPTNGSPVLPGYWSTFFTKPLLTLSIMQGDEGFNYFGLGMLLLILISSGYLIKHVCNQKILFKHTHLPPLCLCTLFIVYALSNEIGLGPYLLLHYSLPSVIQSMADIFRASGRFFWPVYYVLMISVFYYLHHHLNKTLVSTLFSLALLCQLADLSHKLNQLKQYFTVSQPIVQELNSPLWQEIGTRYKKIVFLPYVKRSHTKIANFASYIHFAALHHMKVNIGYFAREETKKFFNENKQLLIQAKQGKLASDTLYIILKPQIATIIKHGSSISDRKERIGTYLLIAPAWNRE